MICVWDNRKPRPNDSLYFIETRFAATGIGNFLRGVYGMGRVVATAPSMAFADTEMRKFLGDVVDPRSMLNACTPRLIELYESVVRDIVERWDATLRHPEEYRYIVLVKGKLPLQVKKQTELFE